VSALIPWHTLCSGSSVAARGQEGAHGGPGKPVGHTDRDDEPWWAGPSRIAKLDGHLLEGYYIGSLARAVGRSPRTIRRWEQEGTLPPLGYMTTAEDVRGRRRVYTQEQIEAIAVVIDKEVGSSRRLSAPATARLARGLAALLL